MAVTLRDVANKAGVTPVVVSKVLHNKANGIRVSEATAERIREAASELGYKVNIWARNFRTQRTMTIGVLHGTGFPRPLMDRGSRYFAALFDGLIEGAFNHGYSVTMCPKLLGDDPSGGMNDGRFDGLVWYSSSPPKEMREHIIRSVTPIVVLHAHASEFGGRIPTVICDNRQGIWKAMEHLRELGHERIAFVYEAELESNEAEERKRAFIEYVRTEGIGDERDAIGLDWGRKVLERYLVNPGHTAMVCFSDGLAADVIQMAKEKGFKLPEDLSIVGFDSTAFCNELRPELTSVSQPLLQVGVSAINSLIKLINGDTVQPTELLLPCGLDVRNSTCPPKKIGRS